MSSKINLEKVINHWIETSNEDYETMIKLYEAKSFHWALFLGHIATEKLLKALYVKRNQEHAPFTHNLYRLAEKANLDMSHEMQDWLDQITVFNLNARYDDYKREFYNLCTETYCKEWIGKVDIIREWIHKML
jgi:HEPN domain-containing protein